jgi:hypothetical protein
MLPIDTQQFFIGRWVKRLKKRAIGNITALSYPKNKAGVAEYAWHDFPIGRKDALGLSTSVLALFWDGIKEFSGAVPPSDPGPITD